jgi:hypothetical protein
LVPDVEAKLNAKSEVVRLLLAEKKEMELSRATVANLLEQEAKSLNEMKVLCEQHKQREVSLMETEKEKEKLYLKEKQEYEVLLLEFEKKKRNEVDLTVEREQSANLLREAERKNQQTKKILEEKLNFAEKKLEEISKSNQIQISAVEQTTEEYKRVISGLENKNKEMRKREVEYKGVIAGFENVITEMRKKENEFKGVISGLEKEMRKREEENKKAIAGLENENKVL